MPNFYEATIHQTSSTSASCYVAELDKTVTVPVKFLAHAMHGDRVVVKLKDNFGFVQKVLTRSEHVVTGQVQLGAKYAFVRPWSNHFFRDFFVALDDAKGAKDGDVVEVKVVDWGKKDRNPNARIEKVLLHVTPEQYQMYRFGLPTKFSDKVLQEVKALDAQVVLSADRIDLTHLTAFTIDPDDCADRDDALSVEQIKDGYRVGIHIADVTHYLKPGTELDREAYLRGNSLYLTNQVVPMLPERLSNGLCSLTENEDRYCLTLMVQVNAQFEVVDKYVFRSVVRSKKAFSYREAEMHKNDPLSPFYADLSLLDLIGARVRKALLPNELAFNTLHTRWETKSGSLKLSVEPGYSTNRLVQAWMLVANYYASTLLPKAGAVLYRVHKPIEADKLDTLKRKLTHLNFAWDESASESSNYARARAQDTDSLLGELITRSFRSAYYSPEPLGHYALGAVHYTHFTSPIRRYADVIAHRILSNHLDSKPAYCVDMERICQHLSACEKKSDRIATETDQLNAIAFIKGVRYDLQAKVINMSRKGILVKTDLFINAWVDAADLSATWNEETQAWEGETNHYIGELLVVKLKEVNTKTNQIYVKIS